MAVEIEHAVSDFRARFAESGWGVFLQPAPVYTAEAEGAVPVREEVETSAPRRVLVALAGVLAAHARGDRAGAIA